MENLADKQIRMARALLNLGYSYLRTVDVENSEEESGETESRETEGEETEIGKNEVQKKFKASKQEDIEFGQDQFDKKHNDKVIKQQKLKKKTKLEDIPQQFYRDMQQKSNENSKTVKIDTGKSDLEKEVANKSNDDQKYKLNINLPKEFDNTIQQKLERGEELISKVEEELNEKQKNFDKDDQPKIDKDKEHKCNEELIKDSEKENQEIQIQLQIEVPPMPGVEVELYLDVQVDAECRLEIKKQKLLEEKQQNIDENAVQKNIEHTDHNDIQAVNTNIQNKFDEVNTSHDIEGDIEDKINKGLKKNMEKEDIQTELNQNLHEQFDNRVQQDDVKKCEEIQQEDDGEIQNYIYEETMDENHKRILQDIESLICDLQDRENIVNKKIKHNINEEEESDESIAIRIAKITKEIEKLEIDMDQEQDEELEREYDNEFNRLFSSVVKEKFLEKLLLSFNQDAAPYYKRIENLLNMHFPTKLDKINDKISIDPSHSTFNKDIIERSDLSNNAFEEIQEASDKIIEEVENGSKTNKSEVLTEESDVEMKEFEDKVVQDVLDIDHEDKIQEESDVDVEGLSNPDDEVKEHLDWNLQIESEINTDESDRQSLQESEEEIEELNEDVNIVTEIVDDYEVESSSVEECYTPINEKELSPIEESASTDLEECNKEILQNIDKEEQFKCIDSIHGLQGVQEKIDNDKPQKFEDLQLQMEIENIQDLDEIPLKLKIQQEQLEEKLHQQMKTFQEEFYKNSKLEYDKEQQLKGATLNDPIYDEQQKLFYELKDKFQKTKEEYKDLVQKKMIEALQQKVDEKQLLEMKEFPEEFIEPNIEIEDLHKEVLQLQRECTELEPEFSYNIPLVVDEKPSKKKTKNVNYNLYEKLHEIHRKKLCFFADSKEWPEKYLYPSSLLDELFDDPSEVNPNVFVITLYSVDIGYSIKITMKEDEPPVETFYSYAEDSILEFVEREQLPPCLLHLFDKAEPMLFYNGRVIAEIHNKYHDGELTGVYRILLHPHSLSIQSDLNRIIAQCSPVHCSYKQRLKIESKLVRLNFPVMCMDSSPVAGLTIQLQHQLLSRRTIKLNPLKVVNDDSSKFEMDFSKKSQDYTLPRTKLNKPQTSSSKCTDTTSDNIIHHLLWKFEFRIQTFKLIKLYVFVVTETREYSMLLCMNSKVPLSQKMRIKINLETNKLKAYIDVILEILKQKVNPDMLVVRRYKSDDKSVPRSIMCVPSLLNDHIYEPSPADFCKLLVELLVNIPKYQPDEQNTDETKICLKVNEKMESKKKGIIGSSKSSPRNLDINMDQKRKKQVKTVESKKSIPHKVESLSTNTIFVDSKTLKNSTTQVDVSLDLNTKSLPKNSLNSKVKPSLIGSKSDVIFDNSSINLVHKELDSIAAKEISLVSSPMTILPSVSSNFTNVSLEQSYTGTSLLPVSSISTVMSSAPRYKTIFSSAALNTDYRLTSKNVQQFEDHSVSKDIKSKPVMQSKTDHTKFLGKNDISQNILFDNINSRPPIFSFEGTNYKSQLSSCDNDMEENIKVVKHVHRNSICVKGPEITIQKERLPLIANLSEGRFSNEPNDTYYQETTQLNDDSTKNTDSLSNLQVTSPNHVITLLPTSFNEFNNQYQTNDVSYQEIYYTSSSNTEDINSTKRKRTS